MDAPRFDHFTRLLGRATARRRLLAGLAMSPLAGLVAGGGLDEVAAKKKRKNKGKKSKKPQPNAYGCLDVGKACSGDGANCCSGLCEGAKPKKGKKDASRCVAHDASYCKVDFDFCGTGGAHFCQAGSNSCACARTTGNAPFCADFTDAASICRECARDTDCHEEFGPGAACVVYQGFCGTLCPETDGAACRPACPDPEM